MQAMHSDNRNSPLTVGCIKANIGNAETASGVAGLIKVVLSLQHEVIPKQFHLASLNPNLPDLTGKIIIPVDGPVQWRGSNRVAGAYFVLVTC
jgi:acyl transferase domain-containing protein